MIKNVFSIINKFFVTGNKKETNSFSTVFDNSWIAKVNQTPKDIVIKTTKLPCGYTMIPLVINGCSPSKTVNDIAQRTFKLLEQDSADDKLAKNYTFKGLNLKDMIVFSVLWDFKTDQPVLVTGVQHITNNTCRLFSRYYLFKNYRTTGINYRYDKVDDFQVDMYHLRYVRNSYPFIFWSREKGNRFFNRIKQIRPDIFNDWNVYDHNIELIWENNWQGIFYTGPEKYVSELIFNK